MLKTIVSRVLGKSKKYILRILPARRHATKASLDERSIPSYVQVAPWIHKLKQLTRVYQMKLDFENMALMSWYAVTCVNTLSGPCRYMISNLVSL
jgi:hypothetical protein